MKKKDKELHETISKWQMMSALTGINMNRLWDSSDNKAHHVFEAMEQIEEFNQMVKDNEPYFRVAQNAATLGLTTDILYKHHEYLNELAAAEERKRLEEEERSNPRLKVLHETHGFKFVHGSSQHQYYWEFNADLGHGPTLYKCRLVIVSYWKKRIWREWKDAQGVKHMDMMLLTSSDQFHMDNKWPEAWLKQYSRRFSNQQLPYAYTQKLLTDYANSLIIKPKRKRSRKATV